jgi:hypothetical protein
MMELDKLLWMFRRHPRHFPATLVFRELLFHPHHHPQQQSLIFL